MNKSSARTPVASAVFHGRYVTLFSFPHVDMTLTTPFYGDITVLCTPLIMIAVVTHSRSAHVDGYGLFHVFQRFPVLLLRSMRLSLLGSTCSPNSLVVYVSSPSSHKLSQVLQLYVLNRHVHSLFQHARSPFLFPRSYFPLDHTVFPGSAPLILPQLTHS